MLFQDLDLIFSLFVVDFIHVLSFSLDFSAIYSDSPFIYLFISFISLL